MSLGVIDRKREIEYTQKQLEGGKCITRKVSPEELEKILNERGNTMGKRGPKPGFKKDKRVNINELADQAVIQSSKAKKDLADAVRKNIEAEIDATQVTEKAEKVTDKTTQLTEKAEKITENPEKVTEPIKDWDVLAAQTKGAVLQERATIIQCDKYPSHAQNGISAEEFRKKLAESKAIPVSADADVELIEMLKPSQIKIEDHLDEGAIKRHVHHLICRELNELYVAKNHDYGDSFSETYRKLGIISAVTRITDKVNRLQSMCTKKQMVNDESVRDTLRDLANYAIMEMEAQG